jgi:hypothetical protein
MPKSKLLRGPFVRPQIKMLHDIKCSWNLIKGRGLFYDKNYKLQQIPGCNCYCLHTSMLSQYTTTVGTCH